MRDENPKFTDKQRRWIDEYCVDFNSAAAARRAGYSEKTAHQIGYENIRKPELKLAIEERMDDLSLEAAQITQLLSAQAIGQMPSTIREVRSPDGEVLEIKTFNTQGALDKLARARGLYERNSAEESKKVGIVFLPALDPVPGSDEPGVRLLGDGDES